MAKIWKQLLGVSVATAVVTLAIIYFVPPHDTHQTFKQWFIQHQPTCEECSDREGAICEEAFRQLQAGLKRGEEI